MLLESLTSNKLTDDVVKINKFLKGYIQSSTKGEFYKYEHN